MLSFYLAVAMLRAGDIVKIRPGASIPADGTLIAGESAVNEGLLTGEAKPLRKTSGDRLTGGSINLHGPLVMRVERIGADSVLSGIIRIMDRAQSEKPRIALAADRAARWFVSAVLVIAAATAAVWYGVDASRALWVTVAVLVITCPCALSLATPAALTAATAEEVLPALASRIRNEPGRGIEALMEGRRFRLGTPEYVAALHGMSLPQEMLFTSDDVTVVALGDAQGWLALLTLGDAVRPNARTVVRALKARGRVVALLSGDRAQAVACLARELGIDHAHGGATPEDKLEFVRALQTRGAVVAMIGDGINDAPVLAQAQVSIALGSGSSLVCANADMVLMSKRLDALLEAFDVAQRTMRIVRQNLAWAIGYNAVALPLAVLGHVTPLIAAIGMSSSSLLVVLNALRLLRTTDRQSASHWLPAGAKLTQ